MLLSLMGVLGSPSAALAQETRNAETGVSGNTYVSPPFGFGLEWDRTWDVTDEKIDDDYSLLQLEDQNSLLWIIGSAPAVDVEECVATEISALEDFDGLTDLETIDEGANRDGSYQAEIGFTLTVTDPDTGEDTPTVWLGFVQCWEINDGDANLLISHYGLAESWDDETEAREDLLATLTLAGEAPPSPEETETPDDSDSTTGSDTDGDRTVSTLAEPQGDGDLPANADDLLNLFESSINDIDQYWFREFPLISGGQEYVPPAEFIPWVGQIDTPCGPANGWDEAAGVGDGPFYCPPNQTIYLDVGFANFQMDMVGEIPFLIPVVLAHEVGHHVQELLNMEVCYTTPCLDPNELTSQEIEYMADCYAGSWSRDAELRGRLGSRDIDANIIQYSVILGGGQEGADPGGHGRGPERVWWFLNGYLEGSAKCFETSTVTANWAQGGLPNTQDQVTPAPEDEPTDEPVDEPGGDVAAMGDEVASAEGTLIATQTQIEPTIERRDADGQFVIVYLEVHRPDGEDAPFAYDGWTLVDTDGNAYEIDGRTTDVLLSSAYEDGADEVLEAGGSYNIAIVFDVPEDVEGLTLVNEELGVQIALDI